ncbi:hypothetical protein [Pseudonocardia sp. TRM90224]|nr:hypothetical protein [Pseudonocardia sp. TRM90224]
MDGILGAAVGNPALAREHRTRYAAWRAGIETVLAAEPWSDAPIAQRVAG